MFKIALDAGHGLGTPGKRCMKGLDPAETREWALNSRIADLVEELLGDYEDVEVIRVDDVTGKTDIPLVNRCNRANVREVDIYFSIHHNAGANGGNDGGVTIYRMRDSKLTSKATLQKAYNYIVKANGLKGNRSAPVSEAGFYVLNHTNMPAMLLENGFMDSKTDTPIILTKEHAEKTAQGIVEFLVDYGKLKKKVIETPPSTSIYRVQVGAYLLKSNAGKQLKQLKSKGFDGYVKKVGLMYKVQIGAFSLKANANSMLTKLGNAGFKGYITK